MRGCPASVPPPGFAIRDAADGIHQADAQRGRNSAEGQKGHVVLAPLDRPDVRPVQPAFERQVLLRPAALFADSPQVSAELGQHGILCRHADMVDPCSVLIDRV